MHTVSTYSNTVQCIITDIYVKIPCGADAMYGPNVELFNVQLLLVVV